MILTDRDIRFLIRDKRLISGYIDLKTQLQPNGFDLTVREIMRFDNSGQLDFTNMNRRIPFAEDIQFSNDGWVTLQKGIYLITTNEYLKIPKNLIGIAYPRTSLLRMGAYTIHGVWDAGFEGRSQFPLVVSNEHGVRLQKDARVAQIIFMRLSSDVERGYDGIYKKLV